MWVTPLASRTEAGLRWWCGAESGASREHYEKGFLDVSYLRGGGGLRDVLFDIFDSWEGVIGINGRYELRGWLEGAEASNGEVSSPVSCRQSLVVSRFGVVGERWSSTRNSLTVSALCFYITIL